MNGSHRREPSPTQCLCRWHVGRERALGLTEDRRRCLIALADERRQPVEQQVDPARRVRRWWGRSRSPCYLQRTSAYAGEAARDPSCYERLQIRFAGENGIEAS